MDRCLENASEDRNYAIISMRQINCASGSGHIDHSRSVSKPFFSSILCIVLVFVLVVITFRRNNYWSSATNLLMDTCLKSPKKSRPFNSLGKLYADLGQYDLAIANFTTAIKNGTGRQDLHYYNLGLAYVKKGDHYRAVSAFRQALDINAAYLDAWYQLSIASRSLGMFEEAKRALTKAISLDPGRSGFYNDLGGIYFVSKQYHLAQEAFLNALRIKPDYSEAIYNLALVYDTVGKTRDAVGLYEHFIRVTPEGHPAKKEAIRRIKLLSD